MEPQSNFQPGYGSPNVQAPMQQSPSYGTPTWIKVTSILTLVLTVLMLGVIGWLVNSRIDLKNQLSGIQKDISDGTISVVQNDEALKNVKESITVESEPGEFADERLLLGKEKLQSVIGINTRNPASELHIRGAKANGGDPDLQLESNDNKQSWVLTVEGANKNRFGIYNKTSNTNPFFIGSGAPNGSFFIDDRGFLGLGTVTPQQKLHVTGNVRIDGLTQAGFADRKVCFDKDGVLRPCREQ
ncbi:hypothetical protein KBB17_00535 [Candidatus Saccharibacteria bacterium]|jgi:hypothetical protein|nr:hypothetical protein [Candidatus Saccharibacteria bacterium]MBP9131564.1 hypothetical protein [Candidatus Saccharibacteria bacterium]